MSRPQHRAAIAVAITAAMLAAGCGNAAPAARSAAAGTSLPGPAPLATTLVTSAGTWAAVVMGGSAATHDNFWQLFARPAGSTRWKLVTPPGVASNGGLALADLGGAALITGFRPSQDLTYTPLTATRDGGQTWSSASPLDAALANVPDALAAAPGSGNLLALLADGTASVAAPGYTRWTALTSQRSLAASGAGKHCGLRTLTAAAFSPAGIPMLAGTCGHPGMAGIFTARNRTWQAAGPPLADGLARQTITVLRLTRAANLTVALLAAAGTGTGISLVAAWSADNGNHWALSPLFSLNHSQLTSTSFGPAGTTAIVLNGHRGAIITDGATAWQPLPPLPPGTATLAPGPQGTVDALAVHRTTLSLWHFAPGPGSRAWKPVQAISVPVQFGSS